jgi:hypothetical protein
VVLLRKRFPQKPNLQTAAVLSVIQNMSPETKISIYGTSSLLFVATALFAVILCIRTLFLNGSILVSSLFICLAVSAFFIAYLIDLKLLEIPSAISFTSYRFLLLLIAGVFGIPLGILSEIGFGIAFIGGLIFSILYSWYAYTSFKAAARQHKW